ncbi:MAG: MCE family protein [Mycolicibacterium sp.]|jgi:phospholipid/cholesterol/gamma-HCH transport system substrate-binding protein|uniref:Mammalian cell entry protein n=1 Tax=Mycolicibacterium insubricum TaxID=444597 RepID=A0A1X0D6K8_9MYCO|nr:MlaD family protein [Mycolicibacterium insubricum]MCB9440285.1 MCE family protein [Mycolicibacterium sp.]MCV7081559.1 MCE family protein [Mycolicibacterium insubricum]ORA68024.1 mammalian cell entry protein [Mycolicibacterium insubricum]
MKMTKYLLSFGAFALMIAVAITYIGSFGLRTAPPDHRINLSMEVPEIKGLVVGSSVLLRGAVIGRVTRISAARNDATVDFYIDGGREIPVDSEIRLENLSALGEAFIGFKPRTAQEPYFIDGQHIATEAVVVPPSISELATSVVRFLDQMDPGQLKRILDEADEALPDPDDVLPNLSRASSLTRNMVTGLDGKGAAVLENFQTLLQNAGWVGPQLAASTEPIRTAGLNISRVWHGMMFTVAWNNPENMQLFQKFLDRVQHFLDDRGGDLKVISGALLPQFSGIGGALMNFDTAQILSNALSGTPEEGAITLHVAIPDR